MTSLNHTFDGNCVNLLIEVTVTNPNIGLLCYPVYSEAIKKTICLSKDNNVSSTRLNCGIFSYPGKCKSRQLADPNLEGKGNNGVSIEWSFSVRILMSI